MAAKKLKLRKPLLQKQQKDLKKQQRQPAEKKNQ